MGVGWRPWPHSTTRGTTFPTKTGFPICGMGTLAPLCPRLASLFSSRNDLAASRSGLDGQCFCRSACSAGEPCIRSTERAPCTMQIVDCTLYIADCRHWAAKVEKVHGEGGYWIQWTVHCEGGQHIAQCTDHIQFQRCMYIAHCESNQSKRGEYSAQCKERHSALQRWMYIVQCTMQRWTAQSALQRWSTQQ